MVKLTKYWHVRKEYTCKILGERCDEAHPYSHRGPTCEDCPVARSHEAGI